MRIAVLGAGGQLAQCINQELSSIASDHQWIFWTKDYLDLTWDKKDIESMLVNNEIDLVINCAAYTNVSMANDQPSLAMLVNYLGTKKLAEVCTNNGIELIHISTDYVYKGLFDFEKNPISERRLEIPSTIYGLSKLRGDDAIKLLVQNKGLNAIILRTSSLFYEFGRNFFTKVLEVPGTPFGLYGFDDQLCTPTYGRDLARRIIRITLDHELRVRMRDQIIYNISGDKVISRYKQVSDIVAGLDLGIAVRKTYMKDDPTNARSSTPLDNESINKLIGDPISYEDGLKECINRYKQSNL